MRKLIFKIIGPRRCGTNYLEFLLRNNFSNSVVFRHGLWHKHSNPYEKYNELKEEGLNQQEFSEQTINKFQNDEIIYTEIIKNPYAFYYSFEKDYSDGKFNEFNNEAINDEYNKPVNGMIDFLIKTDTNSGFFYYENLLENTKVSLEFCSHKFNCYENLSDEIKTPSNRMNKEGDTQDSNRFDPSFYYDQRYLDLIPDNYLNDITKKVDNRIFDYFGFDKIE